MGIRIKDRSFFNKFDRLFKRYAEMSSLADAQQVLGGFGEIGRSWGCNGDLCSAILNEYFDHAIRNRSTPQEGLSYSLFDSSSGKTRARKPEDVLAIYRREIQTRSP